MQMPTYDLLICWVSYLLKTFIQLCCCRISLELLKLNWIGSSKRPWYMILSMWAFTICYYQLRVNILTLAVIILLNFHLHLGYRGYFVRKSTIQLFKIPKIDIYANCHLSIFLESVRPWIGLHVTAPKKLTFYYYTLLSQEHFNVPVYLLLRPLRR